MIQFLILTHTQTLPAAVTLIIRFCLSLPNNSLRLLSSLQSMKLATSHKLGSLSFISCEYYLQSPRWSTCFPSVSSLCCVPVTPAWNFLLWTAQVLSAKSHLLHSERISSRSVLLCELFIFTSVFCFVSILRHYVCILFIVVLTHILLTVIPDNFSYWSYIKSFIERSLFPGCDTVLFVDFTFCFLTCPPF